MDIPTEQTAPFARQRSKKLQTTSSLASHRVPGGDCGDDDDDDGVLPVYARFADLQAAKIVSSWMQLRRLIDEQGFPPGRLLSPNVRVFSVSEVKRWLASRPVADDTTTTTKEDA